MISHPLPQVLHYLDAIQLREGGVVRCVLDLCQQLAAIGVPVTLATHDAADAPPHWIAGGPHVATFAARDRAAIDRLVAAADVVHLHTPWDRENLLWASACRQADKPFLISAHGMLDDWSMAQKPLKKRLFWLLAARRLLTGAARVHCTAAGEARQAERWYAGTPSAVLPLVVDIPHPAQLPGPELALKHFPGLAAGGPVILFLSRVHPKKGIELLLDAANQLPAALGPWQLAIAGPGDDSYVAVLKARADGLGIANRTHWLGMVSGELKWSLYQAAAVFVLPTYQENFGLVLPESLACGTPVITTRAVDIWPELEAAGGVIVPHDPRVISQQLAALLGDPSRRATLAEQGRATVAHWLDPVAVGERYAALYAELAK